MACTDTRLLSASYCRFAAPRPAREKAVFLFSCAAAAGFVRALLSERFAAPPLSLRAVPIVVSCPRERRSACCVLAAIFLCMMCSSLRLRLRSYAKFFSGPSPDPSPCALLASLVFLVSPRRLPTSNDFWKAGPSVQVRAWSKKFALCLPLPIPPLCPSVLRGPPASNER